MRYAIIIGAGPAGLTAAYELLTKTDILPILIEQDKQPGGLSKTVDHHGNKIDIGGHRFFSKSEKVVNWWLRFLPLDPANAGKDFHIRYRGNNASFHHAGATVAGDQQVMMLRPRKSRIYFNNQFFNYPIQISGSTLLKLGLSKTLRIAFTYARAKLFPIKTERSLADFYRNRFGSELYHTFFEDYTRKVWGVPCEKLPATWGRQRVKDLSIGRVIRHAFKSILGSNKTIRQEGTSTSLIEQFMYPRYGPGQMWETVAKAIEEMGGKICYNTTVTSVNAGANGYIRSAEVTDNTTGEKNIYEGDYFFSTMPVKELVEKLDHLPVPAEVKQAAGSLEYRDFLIVGILASALAVKESNTAFTDNWIYIQDKHIKAGRVQLFHNWSPYMVKDPGDIWIGVEYFCNETDEFWQQDDGAIASDAVREMEAIGILHAQQVKDKLVVKVKKAYPSYFGGYKNFGVVQEFLDRIDNLYLIGRNGMHRYNNSDHSMLTAMAAVENIITGRKGKTNIWEINTEEAYHEEKNAGSTG